MVRIAVIGCGYWGPNYIRIFNELEDSCVQCCCDLEERNLAKVKRVNSSIKIVMDYKEAIKDRSVDAVVITTPLNTHYKLAKLCLENGKHTLVEKPFVTTSKESQELMRIAERKNLVLMVGHVYEYNPGINKLKEIIKDKELGSIYYVYSERVGLGPIRKYANVLWDLTIHDISIALYLLDELPVEVTAVGEYYIQTGVKDIVFLSLKFSSRIIYNLYASWIAPEKIRRTTVVGSKGMAVFDDVNKSEMLKIYERNIDKSLLDSTPEYKDHQLVVNIGNVYIPKIEQSEPLKNQAKHFLECILKNKRPLTDARDGVRVVKILEAAEESLRTGKAIKCR